MAGVDTSIYGNLLQQRDPLAAYASIASTNNAIAQNRLLQTNANMMQQEFRAKQAMGQIMQGAVGPDGKVDYAKVIQGAATNPDAAFLAPDLIAKGYANQQLDLNNTLSKLSILKQKQQMYGDAAAGLLKLGTSVTPEDVAKSITTVYAQLASAGLADGSVQDDLIRYMGSLPTDSKALYGHLQEVAMRSAGAVDSLNRVTGAFTPQTLGGVTYLGYTDPANRQWTPVMGPNGQPMTLAQQPTAAERNAPTATVDSTGAEHTGARQDVLPMYDAAGNPVNAQAPAAQPAPAGPGPTVGNAPGGGTMADNLAAAGVPPGAGGPQPAAQPVAPVTPSAPIAGSAVLTKLSPETQAWISARGANMGDYSKHLNQDAQAAQTQLQVLQQLQDLSTKGFHPGAGAGIRTQLGQLMQGLGMPREAYDAVANGSLSASQAFQKYSVQNTMNVLRQAIGGQGRLTNLEFEQFLHSNPNLDTDPNAIKKILGISQKIYMLKLAEQKGLDAWTSAGHAPADFPAAWTAKLLQRGIVRQAKPGDLSIETGEQ